LMQKSLMNLLIVQYLVNKYRKYQCFIIILNWKSYISSRIKVSNLK
jgi:hypothetical protein